MNELAFNIKEQLIHTMPNTEIYGTWGCFQSTRLENSNFKNWHEPDSGYFSLLHCTIKEIDALPDIIVERNEFSEALQNTSFSKLQKVTKENLQSHLDNSYFKGI